jgi:hypothetical protein
VDVRLALLADSANVSREGKLNILGIFDTIYTRQLPTTHPQMQLVLRFLATPDEAGVTRAVEVQLTSSAGQVLLSLPGKIAVQAREPGESIGIDHVLSLNNLSFESSGRYAFRILVDGTLAATVPLRVEQVTAKH